MKSKVLNDRWLTFALLATTGLYVILLLLRPSGEGWGRGWNMVAFLIYSVPIAIATGMVALWRIRKTTGTARRVAGYVAAAALLFPVVCIVAIQMKA